MTRFFFLLWTTFFCTQLTYSQQKQNRYDQFPFFLRGIYQLDKISIAPKLVRTDTTSLAQPSNCLNLEHLLDNSIPDSILLLEITPDSIKFLNSFCFRNTLNGFFELKSIKLFTTTHNLEKPGHIVFDIDLADKSGNYSTATIKFPQLRLEFKDQFKNGSNVYWISGNFKMIKYRHIDDNSLRPVLKRIE